MIHPSGLHGANASPTEALLELAARAAEGSFAAYHHLVWQIMNPGVRLQRSWYLEGVLDHLEAVARGQIKRLIINVPPGSGKTVAGSFALPTYLWLQKAGSPFSAISRVLAGSYSMDFSARLNRRRLDLMQSKEWQGLFRPQWGFNPQACAAELYENTLKGWMAAISPDGGVATGEHCNMMLIDDPQDPKRAASIRLRELVELWIRDTLESRFRDHADPCIVVIMQRLHGRDATEIFRSIWPDFTTLAIDALAPKTYATGVAIHDPRRPVKNPAQLGPGEAQSFDPARYPLPVLMRKAEKMASFGWQYRQHAEGEEGAVFKAGWFKPYAELPHGALEAGTWCASMDTTFGRSNGGDFVVIGLMVAYGGNAYVVDERRGRWTYPEALAQLRSMAAEYPQCERWQIEGGSMANGKSLVAGAREPDGAGRVVEGVVEIVYQRGDDKTARALSVSPIVKMGRVFVPMASKPGCAWVDAWVQEHTQFPGGAYDDRVDVTSMNLHHLRKLLFSPVIEQPKGKDWTTEAPALPGQPSGF